MTLFSGLGTDVHFSGDETGLQWEDYLFELQNAVEWRMVMSRGQDERSQMHATSLLLNTCSGMTNRVLIDDGARWILQGDEQERENRTAGVKALYSMLRATTSGRAKELVKQGLSDGNGMIAFGRIRERFGKTAGVAKFSDVFQFQWTSPDSLEDKWLRWQKLMRQVNMTSLGDDARETLTIAGLEMDKERSLEQQDEAGSVCFLRRSGGGCILLQRCGKRDFMSIRVRKSCEINAITFSTMKREVQSLKSELRALRTGHLSTSEVRLPWTPEEKLRHEFIRSR